MATTRSKSVHRQDNEVRGDRVDVETFVVECGTPGVGHGLGTGTGTGTGSGMELAVPDENGEPAHVG